MAETEEIRAINFVKKSLIRKNEKIAQMNKKLHTLQEKYENLKVKYSTQEAKIKAWKEVCQLKGIEIEMPSDDDVFFPKNVLFEKSPASNIENDDNEGWNLSGNENNSSPEGTRKSHRRKNVPIKAIKEEPEDDSDNIINGNRLFGSLDSDDDDEPLSKRIRTRKLGNKLSRKPVCTRVNKVRPAVVSETRKRKNRTKTKAENHQENDDAFGLTTPDSEVTIIENISTVRGKAMQLTPHLLCNGFRYIHNKGCGRNRIYWVCARAGKDKCRGTMVTTLDYKIISARNIHCHPPDFVRMLVEEALSRIRQALYEPGGLNLNPQEVYDKEHAWARAECARRGYSAEEFAEKMPTAKELRSMISRCRRNAKKLLVAQIEDGRIDGGVAALAAAEGGGGSMEEVGGQEAEQVAVEKAEETEQEVGDVSDRPAEDPDCRLAMEPHQGGLGVAAHHEHQPPVAAPGIQPGHVMSLEHAMGSMAGNGAGGLIALNYGPPSIGPARGSVLPGRHTAPI